MIKSSYNYDYNTMVRDDLITLTESGPVKYDSGQSNITLREDIHSCDLYASVNAQQPLPVSEEIMTLRLGDIY